MSGDFRSSPVSSPPQGVPGEPLLADLADAPRRRQLGRLAGVLCILLMIGLVVGPVLYVELPREIARWHIAAALEKRLAGDLDGAIQSLDKALEKFPGNDELYRQLASWRLASRQYEAGLADANRAVALAPNGSEAYFVRSQLFQRLGRHTEAIADWNTVVRLAETEGGFAAAVGLNGRAYARAVGGIQLKEALADVEQALRQAGDNAAMLDTRGFIRYLQGDDATARADLEKAVRMVEGEHEALMRLAEDGRTRSSDPREFELQLHEHAENVAVIRYHRALIYDQLGEKAKAEEDRRRVRELGFEPNERLF